jgi:hypothetical protein
MQLPFETPEKLELRGRATVALEAAGFVLREELLIHPLPPEFGSSVRVKGDIQADGAGRLQVFYLWVDGGRPLSGWIESVVRGARAIDETVDVYIVAPDPSDVLVKSCEVVGAGLFALSVDDVLTLRVDPGAFGEQERLAALRKRASDLRRRLKTKAGLETNRVEDRYASVHELTAAMDDEERERWTQGVQDAAERVADWEAEVEELIERAAADEGDEAVMDGAEARLLEGPGE